MKNQIYGKIPPHINKQGQSKITVKFYGKTLILIIIYLFLVNIYLSTIADTQGALILRIVFLNWNQSEGDNRVSLGDNRCSWAIIG